MKKERQVKQFMSKFLNAVSLFLLVFSMFSTPLVTVAETSEGTPSTEAVQPESAIEAPSSATEDTSTEAVSSEASVTETPAPAGGVRAAATRAPKEVDDVITSIKYTNNEGGELNWSLAPWATFKINATFALPNNKIHAGDTTTVSVPSQLIINSTDYELKGIDKDGNEQIAAYAHVDPTYKKLTLTYTDFAEKNSDVEGHFFFYVRVDHLLVPNAEKIPISLTVGNKIVPNDPPQPPVDYIGVEKPDTYTLNKVGSYNREATTPTLNYTIAINRKPINIKNAVLRDTLQFTNAKYDKNSFIVEKGQWVWENANWVFKNAETAAYEISFPDDKSFEIKIANITDKEMYRIRYNVILGYIPLDNEKFVNNATLNGEDSIVKNAEARVLWQKGGGNAVGYAYHIKLHKQNEAGEPLQGAQFKIVRNANKQTLTHTVDGKETDIFTSDENGDLNVPGLLKDDYTVTEVAAPNGYQLLKDPVTISETDFAQDNPNFDVTSKILTVVISNKKQNNRQLKVTKKWNDKENQYKTRPASVTVNLLKDGVIVEGKSLVLSADNQWTGAFTDLDETGNYSVQEVDVIGYVATVESEAKDSVRLVNSLETTEVSGNKTWKDDNNRDGKRPSQITVNLLADGEKVDSLKVKADKDGNWTYSFKDLPKYKDGKEIVYTVSEEAVEGYTSQLEGTNLTNTYTPAIVSIEGSKTWKDDNNRDGLRPSQITVNLLANGKKVDSAIVSPDASGNWTYRFQNLPKYKDGKEITYTISEEKVPGYSSKVEGTNLINSHTPATVSVKGSKTWKDADNRDGLRPSQITVILKKALAGSEAVEVARKEVTAKDKWAYEFKDLPKYENGQEIVYSVDEEVVPGYETSVEGTNLTNTHTPERTAIPFSKVWQDDGNQDGLRPESIVVNLLANGKKVATQTLTAETGWAGIFENLPKYEAGKVIVYTLEEEKVANYTADIDQTNYVITNTHKPGETHLTVTKRWDDENNKAGIRPKSIKVQLFADGKKAGNEIEFSEANKWTYTFSKLPEKANGKTIVYTASEMVVPAGYEGTKVQEDPSNVTLINKHKPTVPPSTPPSTPEKPGRSVHKKLLPSTGTVVSVVSIVLAVALGGLAVYILKKKKN